MIENETAAVMASAAVQVWLTAQQAADYAQVSTKLIYREVKAGRLRAHLWEGGES